MSTERFETGDYVTDLETLEDPDLGVIIETPDATIDQWVLEGPEDDPDHPDAYTVSDDNPNYDRENKVVLAAFIETGLEDRWPEWRSEYPDGLYEGVKEHGVKFYAFPETRLQEADADLVAETLADN